MRMPDSSSKQTFPASSTLQRCWFGSVGRVVDGDGVVVVVDDGVVDFVLTLTTKPDALLSALECLNENSEPPSPLKHATTASNRTQPIRDTDAIQSHKNYPQFETCWAWVICGCCYIG